MKTIKSFLVVATVSAFFFGCEKDKAPISAVPQPTPYYVRLTDAPGPYTAVNVDIQSIIITGNGTNVTLNTTPGIYNLLDFDNGVDTLIATGNLTIDQVSQIRLVLGPNNSVVTGGQTYPLKVPSGEQSGLKLQVHQTLQAGVAYYVLLDFDANKSVVTEGNGSYLLKPVISTIETAISGSLRGQVNPPGVSATVTAASGTSNYSTTVNGTGDFIFRGLPAGVYSLTVSPVAPYTTTTVSSSTVTIGNTTNVGTLNI